MQADRDISLQRHGDGSAQGRGVLPERVEPEESAEKLRPVLVQSQHGVVQAAEVHLPRHARSRWGIPHIQYIHINMVF